MVDNVVDSPSTDIEAASAEILSYESCCDMGAANGILDGRDQALNIKDLHRIFTAPFEYLTISNAGWCTFKISSLSQSSALRSSYDFSLASEWVTDEVSSTGPCVNTLEVVQSCRYVFNISAQY